MASAIHRAGVLAVLIGGTPAAHASFDCSSSHGGWRVDSSDSWTGSDKLEHIAVSAPFGALGGYLARDTAHPIIYGSLIGTVPGLAKEIVDGTCRSDGFSYKDLTADLLGALVGASFAHWAITYQRDAHSMTMGVRYSSAF